MNHSVYLKRIAIFSLIILYCNIHLHAYDIAVKNEDGVTIYYNYSSDGKELQVAKGDYSTISSISIPETVNYMNRNRKVTSIAMWAFKDCKELTSIAVPRSIISINYEAFAGCHNLKKTIVKDLAAWCNIGFSDFKSNPLYYSKSLYYDEITELKDIVIPEGVLSIRDFVFSGCSSLNTIALPESVETIGRYAFCDCSSLSSIVVNKNLKYIGEYAFSGCKNMVAFTIPNEVNFIGNNAFSYCSGLTSVVLPQGITSIEGLTFKNCTNLQSITFGNSIQTIKGGAFEGCSKLASVILPNSLNSIGISAFMDCSSLSNIIFGENISTIDNSAFKNCSSLKTIILPQNIISIDDFAFEDIDLEIIISKMQIPSFLASNAFSSNTFYNATLYIPEGTKELYKAAGNWKKFVFIEEGLPEEPSAIENIYSKLPLTIKEGLGLIRIDNAEIGSLIQVFAIDGTKLMTIPVTKEQIDISLPRNSIYIVKVANITKKIHL